MKGRIRAPKPVPNDTGHRKRIINPGIWDCFKPRPRRGLRFCLHILTIPDWGLNFKKMNRIAKNAKEAALRMVFYSILAASVEICVDPPCRRSCGSSFVVNTCLLLPDEFRPGNGRASRDGSDPDAICRAISCPCRR